MAAKVIPKRSRGPSGTRPTLSWTELVVAMNHARRDENTWEKLRPAAIHSLQRGNSRLDATEASDLFSAMRKFTPGCPPASTADYDE
jgi:hypothetical protein